MSIRNNELRKKLYKKPKQPSDGMAHIGRSMLHTARDLDDAGYAIIFNKRRDHVRNLNTKEEEEHRAKVAAVTLPKLKWMGQ